MSSYVFFSALFLSRLSVGSDVGVCVCVLSFAALRAALFSALFVLSGPVSIVM